MAIDYSLLLDSARSPTDLAELLVEYLPLRPCPSKHSPVLAGVGLTVGAMSQCPTRSESTRQVFGIDVRVGALCRLDKFDRHAAGMDLLLELCGVLLAELPCDLVLLWNDEKGVLLRKGGIVTVDGGNHHGNERWGRLLRSWKIAWKEARLPTI